MQRNQYINYLTSRKEIIKKKVLISQMCENREVLDIGCVDHSFENSIKLGEEWLHGLILKKAKDTLGVDILESAVEQFRKLNYNMICCDIMSLNLGRKFDVVVCGDIIEHLSNTGGFLEALAKHMHRDSKCVITTPNPFSVYRFFKALFDGEISVNEEHTCWIDPYVAYELVRRSSMEIEDFYWIDTVYKPEIKNKYFKILANVVAGYVEKKMPIMRRDFALILKLKSEVTTT